MLYNKCGDTMIGIANDHNGYELKQELTKFLNEKGYNVIDFGSDNNKSDYPLYAFKVGEAIKENKIKYGILICKTGIGMSIACNKVKGVRCSKVSNLEEVILTRSHNDANVLALSSDLNIDLIKKMIITFLTTESSKEERHIRRVELINNYDN